MKDENRTKDQLIKELAELRLRIDESKKAEAKYRNLLESIPQKVFYKNTNSVYVAVNPSYAKDLDISADDFIGKTDYDFYPEELAEKYRSDDRHIMQSGMTIDIEESYFYKGEERTVHTVKTPVRDENGTIVGVMGIFWDISDRKQMERQLYEYRDHLEKLVAERTMEVSALNEQLRQSQKMEAVGLLAGGIAHDFSNILTTIKGCMHLLHMKLDMSGPLLEYVDLAFSAIEKANNLSQSLLAFSSKRMIALCPTEFNEIVRDMSALLSKLIDEHITVTVMLTDGHTTVMGDGTQIEQILLNLINNARDAMPHGGELAIQTYLIEMERTFFKEHGYGRAGRYVLLTVSDTGTGMDEETKRRVFEPFFTTKGLGRGSGLGLAVTYGIVKQHNGYIDVESKPKKGTTFKVYIPLVEAKALPLEGQDRSSERGKGETILLAEDDTDARVTMSEVLRVTGYNVLEAVDGEDAVGVFMASRGRVDLVLLDVRMPKKNGREVYEEIKKVSPGTVVLFTSGYMNDLRDGDWIIQGKLNFISKAAPLGEILAKIRAVLDSGQ